jgi:hypothetical protein
MVVPAIIHSFVLSHILVDIRSQFPHLSKATIQVELMNHYRTLCLHWQSLRVEYARSRLHPSFRPIPIVMDLR